MKKWTIKLLKLIPVCSLSALTSKLRGDIIGKRKVKNKRHKEIKKKTIKIHQLKNRI